MAARALFGVNHLKLNTHAARHGREVAIPLHLFFGVGQTYPAIAMVIPHRVFGIISQFFVKGDGMRFKAHHGLVHPKIRDLRCGMPCCPTGQFIPLYQYNVGPSLLRQMIKC